MVSALVRLHVEAIGSGPPLGLLDEEMRVLGERIIRFYQFDTRLLIERQIQELVARPGAEHRPSSESEPAPRAERPASPA